MSVAEFKSLASAAERGPIERPVARPRSGPTWRCEAEAANRGGAQALEEGWGPTVPAGRTFGERAEGCSP